MKKRQIGPAAEAVLTFLRSIGAKVTQVLCAHCVTIVWRKGKRHGTTRVGRDAAPARIIAAIRAELGLEVAL